MPGHSPSPHRVRRRSVGFLEREGDAWACFLVTYRDRDARWHGYFSFRPRDGDAAEDEIRTADIFLEGSEEEVDRKARELGRPLLNGLLASAIHTAERAEGAPRLRRWFREMLSENSREVSDGRMLRSFRTPPRESAASGAAGEGPGAGAAERRPGSGPDGDAGSPELVEMRSLYESYRLDQVAHFISLIAPDDFRDAVEHILDGRPFDFGARDRLQFAMIVVEHIEERLPLPPFEIWLEDYLAHRPEYQLYAHTLHRERRLP